MEFDARPGKMTFARLGIWDEKPFMAIMSGESLALSPEERKSINEQTDPTWPHVHVKLDCTFNEFKDIFPCNHVHGIPGDSIAALKYFCDITGIRPVILGDHPLGKETPVWDRV